MLINLTVIDTAALAEKPDSPKTPVEKTDEEYGRDGHKYLTQDQVDGARQVDPAEP